MKPRIPRKLKKKMKIRLRESIKDEDSIHVFSNGKVTFTYIPE